MKKLILAFLFVLCLPIYCFGFEIKDLADYSGVAVKTFTERDSLYGKHSNNRIMGSQSFVGLFGSAEATFETEYIYIGDNQITEYGDIEWKYYTPPSWNGRGKGEFKYPSNEVMKSGIAGDLLVVGKKNPDEITLILIQSGNPAINELYDVLGIEQEQQPKESKSFWSNLWESESKQTAEYDLEELPTINAEIPENGWMQVYFTPGTDCEDNIIEQINNAKKIDIAVYSITNEKIVDALINAKNRGAKIRVITDRLQSKGKYSLVSKLIDAGIAVKTNVKHKIMHHKFAIFDGKNIENGSYNWTESASKSNAENCTFFQQSSNKVFSNQFNYLWKLY